MKNFIIGILLLLSAFYLLWEQGQKQIEQQDRVTRALQSDKDLFDANISEDVRIDKPFESFSENNITKKISPKKMPTSPLLQKMPRRQTQRKKHNATKQKHPKPTTHSNE